MKHARVNNSLPSCSTRSVKSRHTLLTMKTYCNYRMEIKQQARRKRNGGGFGEMGCCARSHYLPMSKRVRRPVKRVALGLHCQYRVDFGVLVIDVQHGSLFSVTLQKPLQPVLIVGWLVGWLAGCVAFRQTWKVTYNIKK